MESRLKRIEIVVATIAVLTIINLFKPSILELFISDESTEEVAEELRKLPEDLNKDVLNKIVYKVKTEFNRKDWGELYNVYGDYAKAQLSPELIESEFKKMNTAVGSIGTYAYSHYIYEGKGSSAEWFEFHYKCRFDNGNGTIKISTRTADNVSEVVGINIVLDEI